MKKKLSVKEKFVNTGLVGCCFHSLDENGKLKWQGRILSSPKQDWYLVQLYDWGFGEASTRKLIPFEQMTNWMFYKDEEEMRHSSEHGAARSLHHE